MLHIACFENNYMIHEIDRQHLYIHTTLHRGHEVHYSVYFIYNTVLVFRACVMPNAACIYTLFFSNTIQRATSCALCSGAGHYYNIL